MAKRLKKVNYPKDTQRGPFTRPEAPAELQPAVFEAPAKPAEPSEFAKRVEAAKEKARARQRAQREALTPPNKPPLDPKTLLSTTVVEGKTVADWAKEIESRAEAKDAEGNPTRVIDITDIPGWAIWAVGHWKILGRPTPKTKVVEEVSELREKAEKLVKFAALDKDKAEKVSDTKAKKLKDAADKKSAKAAELFAKANKVAKDFKVK